MDQGVPRCELCGAGTRRDVVKAAFWGPGGLLVAIEGIPARVCAGCGEQFYDEQTVRRIEQAIADPAREARRRMTVPVVSLADPQTGQPASPPESLSREPAEEVDTTLAGTEPGWQDAEQAPQDRQACPCRHCGAETRQDVVRSAVWIEAGLVAVEDIPARLCPQCGEQFYDERTSWRIAELTQHGVPITKAIRHISVPVVSLAEAETS